MSVPFRELVFRDVKIHGSLLCNPDESKEMLDAVAEHGVKVDTYPVKGLKEVPKLVDLAHDGKLKGKGIVLVDQSLVDSQ